MALFRKKREGRPTAADEAARTPAADAAPRTFQEIVSPFYAAGDWEGLFSALDRIDPDDFEQAEAIQWYTSRGLALQRLGRPDEAVSAYSEGLRRFPESSAVHFVMGRLLEEEGRFDEALPHFRAVQLEDGGATAVIGAARYCNLWGALEDAVALQSQIFTAFFALKVADDHFLYTRGLPFFSQAFGAQAVFLVLGERADEARSLLEESEARLSDLGGVEEERLTLEATLGQPAGLIEYLSDLVQREEGSPFRGADGMRLACWQARESDQLAEAEQRLVSVKLRENDFPWLEDIRLLATIAAARRAGGLREDDPRIAELFERQPRLLEPEHVFHFGLLEEQEVLKEVYRARRRELGPPPRGN